MSSKQPCIVGLGELVWDQLPDGLLLPGGAPANFAFHVNQLGANAVVLSAIGNDDDGAKMLRWLNEIGLTTAGVQRNEHPTGRVSVRFDEHGQPRYEIPADAAWDHIEWNARASDLAVEADCVCVGSLSQRSTTSRQTVQRFISHTRRDCIRIFDVNIRDPHCSSQVIRETLEHADVLKLNDEEWPIIARLLNLNRIHSIGLPELLRRFSLRLVALTQGARGSMLVDQDGVHYRAGDEVSVADTVGAGDAFTAALAIGLLQDDPITRIHANAAAIASFVCTRHGGTPRLPLALIERTRRDTAVRHVRKPKPPALTTYITNKPALPDRPASSDVL